MPNIALTERDPSELIALVIRHLLKQPVVYNASTLALELGENPRRVQRALHHIAAAGWTVEKQKRLIRLHLN